MKKLKHWWFFYNSRSLLKEYLPELYNFLKINHIEKEYLNVFEFDFEGKCQIAKNRIIGCSKEKKEQYFRSLLINIKNFYGFSYYNSLYKRYIKEKYGD